MCLSDAIFCRPLCTSSPSSPFSQYRQDHIDEVYRDQEAWTEKSIMSTAGSGFFSSDRTILEYAKCVAGGWGGRALLRGQCTLPVLQQCSSHTSSRRDIWDATPCKVPETDLDDE